MCEQQRCVQGLLMLYGTAVHRCRSAAILDVKSDADGSSTGSIRVKLVQMADIEHSAQKALAGNHSISQAPSLGPFGDLIMSDLQTRVGLTDNHHPDRSQYLFIPGLGQLERYKLSGQLTDLEDCIHNLQNALSSLQNDHPDQPMYLEYVGLSQLAYHEHVGEMTCLVDAKSNLYKAVALRAQTSGHGHVSLQSWHQPAEVLRTFW
jgi:hypothetical protein